MTTPTPIAVAALLDPRENARPVPGFERYWVTNRGRVFSLVSEPRVLSVCNHSKGYLRVDLFRGKGRLEGVPNRRAAYVHELVAQAFIGPRPAAPGVSHDIDHVNGDKRDNRTENLRYLPKGENVRLMRSRGGHPSEKLSAVSVWTLRCAALAQGTGTAADWAVHEYGVSRRTVRDAMAGRTWQRVPDPTRPIELRDLAKALNVDEPAAADLIGLRGDFSIAA